MGTFYLGYTNSDLSGGSPFNKKLNVVPAPSSLGALTISLLKNTSTTAYGFSAKGSPLNVHWQTGEITVKVRTVTGHANMYLSIIIDRINEAGTVVAESTAATAEQALSANNTTYTFTVPSYDWAIGNIYDRVRIRYVFRNASKNSTVAIDIATGTSETAVTTPFTFNSTVTLPQESSPVSTSELPYKVTYNGVGSAYDINGTIDTSYVSPIDDDHFLVTYEKNDNYLYARIGTVTEGTVITYSNEFSFQAPANVVVGFSSCSLCEVASKRLLCTFAGKTTGTTLGVYGVIAVISDDYTTITFGSLYTFEATMRAECTRSMKTSGGQMIFAYVDITGLQYYIRTVYVSGTTITSGSASAWAPFYGSSGYFAMDVWLDDVLGWCVNMAFYIPHRDTQYPNTVVPGYNYARIIGDTFTWKYDSFVNTYHYRTNGWQPYSEPNSARMRLLDIAYLRDNYTVYSDPTYGPKWVVGCRHWAFYCGKNNDGTSFGWNTGNYFPPNNERDDPDYVFGVDPLEIGDVYSVGQVCFDNDTAIMVYSGMGYAYPADETHALRMYVYDPYKNFYIESYPDAYKRYDIGTDAIVWCELIVKKLSPISAVLTYKTDPGGIACRIINVTASGLDASVNNGGGTVFVKSSGAWLPAQNVFVKDTTWKAYLKTFVKDTTWLE